MRTVDKKEVIRNRLHPVQNIKYKWNTDTKVGIKYNKPHSEYQEYITFPGDYHPAIPNKANEKSRILDKKRTTIIKYISDFPQTVSVLLIGINNTIFKMSSRDLDNMKSYTVCTINDIYYNHDWMNESGPVFGIPQQRDHKKFNLLMSHQNTGIILFSGLGGFYANLGAAQIFFAVRRRGPPNKW